MLTGLLILALTAIAAVAISTHNTPSAKRRLAGVLIDAANWLVSCSTNLYASADADDHWHLCYADRKATMQAAYARQAKEGA